MVNNNNVRLTLSIEVESLRKEQSVKIDDTKDKSQSFVFSLANDNLFIIWPFKEMREYSVVMCDRWEINAFIRYNLSKLNSCGVSENHWISVVHEPSK